MSDLHDPLPTYVVQQRCGTCGHPHRSTPGDPRDDGWWPGCDCGCAAFTLHPDEIAAMQARQDAELLVFGERGPLLSADVAEGIRATLCAVEAHFDQLAGWDAPPAIGAVVAGSPRDTGRMQPPQHPGEAAEPLQMMPLLVYTLDTPRGFWGVEGGDVAAAVAGLARMAETEPGVFDRFRELSGLPADVPVIGWWTVTEAYERSADDDLSGSARTDPRLRADEVRALTFVDVDERVYEVSRWRSTDRQVSATLTQPELREAMARMPGRLRAVVGEGLPVMIDALLRLTRVTRSESELRHALGALR
jgi:hypothetical protein